MKSKLAPILSEKPMEADEKIYTVEIDDRGCSNCGADVGYTVVGPDGVEECAIYNDRNAAEEIAELMNIAYLRGRQEAA